MKKTHLIDLLMSIKTTRVAFISIIMFVMLGIGVFLGFSWTGSAFNLSTNNFIEKYNLHDVELTFPYGFSEDDIDIIRNTEGVDRAEGRQIVYDYFNIGATVYQAKIIQITDELDRLYVAEGTLPAECGEIAVDRGFAVKTGIKLGDVIELRSDREEGEVSVSGVINADTEEADLSELLGSSQETDNSPMIYLNTPEFVVTALVISPEYACNDQTVYGVAPTNGMTIDTGLFVSEASFNESSFLGYTDVIVSGSDLRNMDYSSEEYQTAAGALADRVFEAIDATAVAKKAMIGEKLSAIEKAINTQLEEAEKELSDAQTEIDEKQDELEAGEEELISAQEQLEEADAQISEGEQTVENGLEMLSQAKAELDEALAKLEDGKQQLISGWAEYDKKYKEYLDGLEKLSRGKKALKSGTDEYNEAKETYEDSKADLETLVGIRNDFKSAADDIFSGKVSVSELESYVEEMQLKDKLETLGVLAEKHDIDYASFTAMLTDAVKAATETEDPTQLLKVISDEIIGDLDSIINDFNEKLEDAEEELADDYKKIVSGRQKIYDGKRLLGHYKEQLDEALALLESKTDELEAGEQQYAAGYSVYAAKEQELNEGIALLDEKKAEYEKGKAQLEAGEEELLSAKSELEKAKQMLSDAREDYDSNYVLGTRAVESMEKLDREAGLVAFTRLSVGFLTVTQSIGIVLSSIRYSLAGLFFIVGVLVCYSAVTRLVFSQMKLIGAKKALGLTENEVTLYYLLYTGIAAFVGCILGLGLGYGSECLILNFFGVSYPYDGFAHLFDVKTALAVSIIQLIILLAVTYVSTIGILKKSAITLLADVSQSSGRTRFYEKLGIYRRTGFLNKMIINNAFTDKRRIVGTVIGVMGCTALIVTALTYGRSVSNSFSKHMKQYCHFDHIVYYDNSEEGTKEEMESLLGQYTDIAVNCRYEYDMVEEQGDSLGLLNIFVSDDGENFGKAFTISERENLTGKDPYEGTWIGYGYKVNNGSDCTDVEVTTITGEKVDVPVDGFMDYYLPLYTIIMTGEDYENAFGIEAKYNAFLISISDEDMKLLEEKLSELDGYIMTNDYYAAKKLNFSVFEGISAVLDIIYVVLAVVMSVLVLLNLLRQFIDEKKKELIVMLINGFDIKDVRKYIYTDTIVLTVIGIILGTVLGTALGILTVRGFESGSLYFLKQPDLVSCLCGIFGTAVLSFVMCRISLKKIDDFKLTDISR